MENDPIGFFTMAGSAIWWFCSLIVLGAVTELILTVTAWIRLQMKKERELLKKELEKT